MIELTVRRWTSSDVEAIAALHADSWRRTYRGVFTNEFLDGPVLEDRHRLWTQRASASSPDAETFVACADDQLLGFAHLVAADPDGPGALLDNLHVAPSAQGRGVATQLLSRAGGWAADERSASALHLWVAASNEHAIAVYGHLGARLDASDVHDDGGGPFEVLRLVWDPPALALLAARIGSSE